MNFTYVFTPRKPMILDLEKRVQDMISPWDEPKNYKNPQYYLSPIAKNNILYHGTICDREGYSWRPILKKDKRLVSHENAKIKFYRLLDCIHAWLLEKKGDKKEVPPETTIYMKGVFVEYGISLFNFDEIEYEVYPKSDLSFYFAVPEGWVGVRE